MRTAEPGEERRDPAGGDTLCLVHPSPSHCSLCLHLLLLSSLPRSLGSSPPPPCTQRGAALILLSPPETPKLTALGQLSSKTTSGPTVPLRHPSPWPGTVWGHGGAGDMVGLGCARLGAPRGARPGIEQGTSPPRGADGDLQLHNARSCAGPDGPQGEQRRVPPLPDHAAILPNRLQQRL